MALHRIVFGAAFLACIVHAPSAAQDELFEFDPMTIDIADAINCKLDVPTYNGFAISIGDDRKKRGWKIVKSDNPFLNEYLLKEPITIAGYQTNRIAFSSSAVMAVLDLADPNVAAKQEAITNDAEAAAAALLDGLDLTQEQRDDIPVGNKFMGQKVLSDTTEKDVELNMSFKSVISRTISNVSTLPGKTLYGCSYRITIFGADGKEI